MHDDMHAWWLRQRLLGWLSCLYNWKLKVLHQDKPRQNKRGNADLDFVLFDFIFIFALCRKSWRAQFCSAQDKICWLNPVEQHTHFYLQIEILCFYDKNHHDYYRNVSEYLWIAFNVYK